MEEPHTQVHSLNNVHVCMYVLYVNVQYTNELCAYTYVYMLYIQTPIDTTGTGTMGTTTVRG